MRGHDKGSQYPRNRRILEAPIDSHADEDSDHSVDNPAKLYVANALLSCLSDTGSDVNLLGNKHLRRLDEAHQIYGGGHVNRRSSRELSVTDRDGT